MGAILVRTANSIIFVDEPERHLNPGISGPLLAAAMRARPDVAYVFATHDLPLVEWLRPEKILFVSNSQVVNDSPEIRQYDIRTIDIEDDLDDTIKYPLLGSRKAVLLVEGSSSSDDKALYSLLYPTWHIVPKGGWADVIAAVRAIRTLSTYNWLNAAAIIDGDGRSPEERATLALENIHPLPVPTIENIFFQRMIVAEMAELMFETFGLPTKDDRIRSAYDKIKGVLIAQRAAITARQVVWRSARMASSQKPSVGSIQSGQVEMPAVDLSPLIKDVSDSFDQAMKLDDMWLVIERVPIKNTALPDVIALAIGFGSFKEMKSATINQIERRTSRGSRILEHLRSIAPALALNGGT